MHFMGKSVKARQRVDKQIKCVA